MHESTFLPVLSQEQQLAHDSGTGVWILFFSTFSGRWVSCLFSLYFFSNLILRAVFHPEVRDEVACCPAVSTPCISKSNQVQTVSVSLSASTGQVFFFFFYQWHYLQTISSSAVWNPVYTGTNSVAIPHHYIPLPVIIALPTSVRGGEHEGFQWNAQPEKTWTQSGVSPPNPSESLSEPDESKPILFGNLWTFLQYGGHDWLK